MEELLELFTECNNVTLILSNDVAFDMVEELEMLGCRFNEDEEMTIKEAKELYESDVLMVSKYDGMYFFETAYGYDRLKTVDCDGIVLVEDGVIEDWEIDEYIFGDIFKVEFYEEDDEYEEEGLNEDTDEFLEDMSVEILEELIELEEDDYEVCYLKNKLEELYYIAYNDAVIDMEEAGVLK